MTDEPAFPNWYAHFMWHFRNSETILWARIQLVFGIVVAGLASMNWLPLLNTGLSESQLLTLGVILVAQGIITEVARRFKTKPDDPINQAGP